MGKVNGDQKAILFYHWPLYLPDHGNSQTLQCLWVMDPDDGGERKHGIVRIDGSGFFSSLFNGFHFFLASGVVEWTDDDRLS
jgi:hypothetical protein